MEKIDTLDKKILEIVMNTPAFLAKTLLRCAEYRGQQSINASSGSLTTA